MVKIGIIGGSGLDNPNILENPNDVEIDTKCGKPSSKLKCGKINGVDVVLLARHGREHTIPPTQVNYRANILALKEVGCTHILATTAVGSLREEIGRGDLVIVDQFIDFTRHRPVTYFEEFKHGEMKHTPMAEPYSKELRNILIRACDDLGIKHHKKGTVVTIEGPRFSTKAESHMFRQWGADIINMSIAPETVLANELGIPYAAVAMSTDYDCWKNDEEPVTWEAVIEIFKNNVDKVTNLLMNVIPKVKDDVATEISATQEQSKQTDTDEKIKSYIRTIPNWPKPGIMFRDITTLLKDPTGLKLTMDAFEQRYKNEDFEVIAGIESRGFIIGSILSDRLRKGFVPIRKKGKLPGETVSEEYALEYGTDKIEIHKDAINEGDRVLIVDDLLATGGTMMAAANLIKKLGANVHECAFVIDLPELGGTKKLQQNGLKVFNLIEFEGE